MEIRVDNLESQAVIGLLREHLTSMEDTAPPESRHALDLNALRSPDIKFWAMWDRTELAGFGALKHHNEELAEIKSMRTAGAYLRKGVASQILRHLIEQAKAGGYSRLSLETGSMNYFEAARKLYSSFGFVISPPFASYVEDPNSVFMTMLLNSDSQGRI